MRMSLILALLVVGFQAGTVMAKIAADGKTDVTGAIQAELDEMGKAGGGTLELGKGTFLIKGHLVVPANVCLAGVWQSVPSHVGLRWGGEQKPLENGTTLLATESRGNESGPPFITLNSNATLKGVVIFYPDQRQDETPAAYPYTIVMHGTNCSVLAVEMLNPYNGIDTTGAGRHLICDVQGQPLRRGIYVDQIYDIGRIEDVHFNPWWCWDGPVKKFEMEHGQAFIFGRSDWEYVFNTFAFGYNMGYQFIETKDGVCNGNFLGIGADDCWTTVEVDQSAVFGILITNGEFTAFEGPNPTIVHVAKSNVGAVRFVNCAYWGFDNRTADIEGTGVIGFSDCTFASWDSKSKTHVRHDAQIRASGGTVMVRGCEFMVSRPLVDLEPGVKAAVITDNVAGGDAEVQNHCDGQVVVRDNLGHVPTTQPN